MKADGGRIATSQARGEALMKAGGSVGVLEYLAPAGKH